jgi:hypothetical protein
VFGILYEDKKYLNAVRVCALETDFKTLAAGDQTAIGEKGGLLFYLFIFFFFLFYFNNIIKLT